LRAGVDSLSGCLFAFGCFGSTYVLKVRPSVVSLVNSGRDFFCLSFALTFEYRMV
jgi:hypothetical protein